VGAVTGAGDPAGAPQAEAAQAPAAADDHPPVADDYLAQVMAEIDDEVRRRRAELPVRVERELDALFLEHSPVSGRPGDDLEEALRAVDAAVHIDPLVPVESRKSGGALVKKGLRSLNLWYIGYVTHQVSVFAGAVAGALHALDKRIAGLERRVPTSDRAPVLASGGPGAWWLEAAVAAVGQRRGRVLHAACGDGWLVDALAAAGVDAYGVDPRPGVIDQAELAGADLRQEGLGEHLEAVEAAALDGVVLSGVVDAMATAEREALLTVVADRLSPDGVLVIHSLSPAGWAAEDAPAEADLVAGHPLRAGTWAHVLRGWTVQVAGGSTGADYLVVATR
jgi:2-polyprenyl-3-methyl-5-hydroxy-6-metoxy-1,4-benzoquinol methylase